MVNRLWFWALALIVIAMCCVADAIHESMFSKDLSARAWIAFLPFMAPIFVFQSAMYVVPIAIVFELIHYLRRASD